MCDSVYMNNRRDYLNCNFQELCEEKARNGTPRERAKAMRYLKTGKISLKLAIENERIRIDGRWQTVEEWNEYGFNRSYDGRICRSLELSEDSGERSWYNRGADMGWLKEFPFFRIRVNHCGSQDKSEESSCIVTPIISVMDNDSNNLLSFDKILAFCPDDLRNIAKAIYGKSFGGEISIAFCINDSNFLSGTNSICNFILFKTELISISESLDFNFMPVMFLSISEDKYSGAINLISFLKSFHSNNSRLFPFFTNAEINALESGITIIYLTESNSLYFFANPLLICPPSAIASSSVNSDLSTIECNLFHSNILSRIKAEITIVQSTIDSSSICCLKSSGISIFNSIMLKHREKDYKKVSDVSQTKQRILKYTEAK